MSLYRVNFKWKNKDIQLTAKSLDLTHPYFVSIKDLVFSDKQKIIINPSEDEILKTFSNSKNLMIPFQIVSLIEELDEESQNSKVMPFTLIEESEEKIAGKDKPPEPPAPFGPKDWTGEK